jgi:hypothetical protein
MATYPTQVKSDTQLFEQALAALQGDVATAATVLTHDPIVRHQYQQKIALYVRELRQRVQAGELSWKQAAEEANETRNTTMEALRIRSTPVGKSIAEFLKAEGKSLEDLLARYTRKLFGDGVEFAKLTSSQQEQVYAEVVAAAGRSNATVDGWVMVASRAGKGLIILSLALSVYVIATSDDPWAESKHQAAVVGSGIVGGMAAGAGAGLLCGPGVPVCVTIGTFVGGAMAAFGVDWYFWRRKR